MIDLDRDFWEQRYADGTTGWDLGAVSPTLQAYFDQLTDKDLRILIPGGGRSYEAEQLHKAGFRNVFVIDLTPAPFADLLARCPNFPKDHLITGDFFEHGGCYDLIVEQTFFCALDPALRERYVEHMHRLLAPGGRLVGVLFDDPLNDDHPPFGGNKDEYLALFRPVFGEVLLERCHNSVPPRAGRELWLKAVKR
ncbi:MAG: methyltransferase domain-containing protein [Flavobacteriales bacterium]|nr:methyltransferase domain-containing protein [Flavobacteriales bacterium]